MEKRKHYSVSYRNREYAFVFRYVYNATSGYRAFIESMPDYGSRTTTLSATHRLMSGNEYYICWSEKIDTEAGMDAVVELWSKATVMYIANGGSSINRYAEAIQRGASAGEQDTKTYSVVYRGRTLDFVFRYEHDSATGYRAYILSMPGYGRRDDSLHSTHRLKAGDRHYVCWSDKICTEEQMDAVVALWCKATAMYIESDIGFNECAARLMHS